MTPDTTPTDNELEYFQVNHPYVPIVTLMQDFLQDKELGWPTLDKMSDNENLLVEILKLGSVDPNFFDKTRMNASQNRHPVTAFLRDLQKEISVILEQTFHENGGNKNWIEYIPGQMSESNGKILNLSIDTAPEDVKKLLDAAILVLPKSKKRNNSKDLKIVYALPQASEEEVLDGLKSLWERE